MKKFKEWLSKRELLEYEVHVGRDGYAYDDEGNREYVGKKFRGNYSGTRSVRKSGMFKEPRVETPATEAPKAENPGDPRRVEALKKALAIRPNDFLASILRQVQEGRELSELQKKTVRQNFYKLRMKEEADLFR